MSDEIPAAGGPSPELAAAVAADWAEAARRAGLDADRIDPAAPLGQRLEAAAALGLQPAVVLSRYSTKLQHSTDAQVSECVRHAPGKGLYVPPEYVCVDEGVSGRKSRRDGLDRAKFLLRSGRAGALVVYKVSRLFRSVVHGFQFFQETLVERGLRGLSVSQGIDTRDEKAWKPLAYLHGVMDELQLGAIADQVRSGLAVLHADGFVTGALAVGYRRREVPGGRPTNRGLPRTVPEVDPESAELIRRHFRMILAGVPIREGWRRWVREGGPADPRSRTRQMSPTAYRRLLSNPRLTGVWAFGRKRNVWSASRDYTLQVERPEGEVTVRRVEELRIVDDETFFAVQAKLEALKTGPRAPRRGKRPRPWDLVTGLYACAACGERFHQCGAYGQAMRCRNGLCAQRATVNRKEAYLAVCRESSALIARDGELLAMAAAEAIKSAAEPAESLGQELAAAERNAARQTRRIDALLELAGDGSETDRAQTAAAIRAARAGRTAAKADAARLRAQIADDGRSVTPEAVRRLLAEAGELLVGDAGDAAEADGAVESDDAAYRAAEAFRRLVGGRIVVRAEERPGRKRTGVRGLFTPDLLRCAGLPAAAAAPAAVPGEVAVWLRSPPRLETLGERVHALIDVEGLSYRDAAKVLAAEGRAVGYGALWQIRRRYWEMRGEAPPRRPYNGGRPRKTKRDG